MKNFSPALGVRGPRAMFTIVNGAFTRVVTRAALLLGSGSRVDDETVALPAPAPARRGLITIVIVRVAPDVIGPKLQVVVVSVPLHLVGGEPLLTSWPPFGGSEADIVTASAVSGPRLITVRV